MELVYKDESYRIIGACFEVYKEMGCGFLEAVYQECLSMEFAGQGIPCQSQCALGLCYKGQPLQAEDMFPTSSVLTKSSWKSKR